MPSAGKTLVVEQFEFSYITSASAKWLAIPYKVKLYLFYN